VLRFNLPNRSKVRNYQSRREQWRLLALVMSLGVVLLVIRGIQRPGAIAAFSHLFSSSEPAASADQSPPADAATADAATTDGRQAPDRERLPGETAIAADVRPEALAAIRDNAPFRNAEEQAWFAMLAAVQGRSAAELASQSLGTASAAQLIAQPHAYRAKLVTIHGTARRITSERPAANDLGIASYDRLVIQPRGEAVPIFAYCLTLPAGFPRGDEVAVDVAVTGLFFKNLSYQSENDLAIAPVILANEVESANSANAAPRPAPGERRINTEVSKLDVAPAGSETFNESMVLAGWNAERWTAFADDSPLTDTERALLPELLWRLRTFRAADLDAWSQTSISPADMAGAAGDQRGRLLSLSGRLRRVTRHPLPAAAAARLEMPEYFQCEMTLDGDAGVAMIVTPTVPSAWPVDQPLDEKVGASAVFVKQLPNRDGGTRSLLFAARNVRWYPDRPHEPDVSFGKSLLGGLGMDVALLDGVKNHQPIRAEERDAFFAMLAAVGESGANQLIRFARGNLAEVAQAWSAETESPENSRRLLAREVAERAAKGLYSVAPLFNDADRQIGRLVALEGVTRRVTRIDLGVSADGQPSDVPKIYGFDRYYELDLFTDDSQNRPIVFCVRELPGGFPTGAGLDERVRVAGFFFKSWHYLPRGDRAGTANTENAAVVASGRGLISPLLVGRAPVQLVLEEGPSRIGDLVAGGLFILAFAAVWGLVWWYSRDERQFHERTLKPAYALPAGTSLDPLNLQVETLD
jgi:hypothetical protein